jgi:DNA repair exonuclease SbcCD nuclease subunit
MGLRIFLTADLHLGKKFSGYPEVQSLLCKARFETLGRLIELANEKSCELFVIAGDLFDRVLVAKTDIIKTIKLLNNFQGKLIAVLPGNHDFHSDTQREPWNTFREIARDVSNIILLDKREPYRLMHYDIDAILYPAPCDARHSEKNAISWIRDIQKGPEASYNIGVAHGSLKGFSPDFDEHYYPMTVEELMSCGLDLWLMGHTHAQYPEHYGAVQKGTDQSIFYPGTPEPDGFDCKHEGRAWVLELDDNGIIHPHSLTTGKYRFLHDEVMLSKAKDLEELRTRYLTEEYRRTLIKLSLRGRLPKDLWGELESIIEIIKENLFYLHQPVDKSALMEEITIGDLDREFTGQSFPHRLLTALASEGDNEALQIAYEMIRELRT